MNDRLSDELVAALTLRSEQCVNCHPEECGDMALSLLAREVQEWRAKAAADDEAPSAEVSYPSAETIKGVLSIVDKPPVPPMILPPEWEAAADTMQDNPYKFTVRVEKQSSLTTWVDIYEFSGECGAISLPFDTEAEAREHARLIVAALRNVEVDG